MAKHDARILKFLSQVNDRDRGPTITDIMTKLNISISDISDSLGDLFAQGLVNKKTNSIGLEMWFAIIADPITREPSPSLQPPPVKVDHIPPAKLVAMNPAEMQTQSMPIYREAISENIREPVTSANSMTANNPSPNREEFTPRKETLSPYSAPVQNSTAPNYGYAPMMAKPGISQSAFLGGLAFAIMASIFISFLVFKMQIRTVSKTFVDSKTLTATTDSDKEFQDKTKTHILSMEAEIKSLKDQLASHPVSADSTKVDPALANTEGVKGLKPKEAISKPLSAKAQAAAKKEALLAAKKEALALAKTKALQKKAATAKANKAVGLENSKSATMPTKETLAKGKSKKTKGIGSENESKNSSMNDGAKSNSGTGTGLGYGSSSSETAGEPIPEPSSPKVPTAPGLDNQDLPPPPE